MKKYIPFVIAFALFMETLDATIISTAIPKMSISFGIDPVDLKVALTSYLLSLAIFIPISGWCADRFGTKKIFISALLAFTIGSLLCGLSVNIITLVLSRIIQGIGGALMMPVGRLILLKSFPKSELIKATNYVTIPALTGPALGPVLGGIIVSYISWRWIFIVNIPFGIAGIVFAMKVLENHIAKKINKLDFLGFILFGIGLSGFSFAIESIGNDTLNFNFILWTMLFSLFVISIYFLRSRHVKFPFIDISIFKIKTFRITVAGSFLSRCGMGGMPFLLPIFFQLGLGKSPLESGLLLLPYAIAMLMTKFFVRGCLKLFGFKNLLIVNTCLLGLSILAFNFVSVHVSIYLLIIILFAHGLLTSLQFSCMNNLTYIDLTEEIASSGTSIASAAQQLSMSFGIAISAIALEYLLGGNGNSFYMQANAFHLTFVVVGLITLLSTFIFTFLGKHDGLGAVRYRVKNRDSSEEILLNEESN